MTYTETLRDTELGALTAALNSQRARSLDVVLAATDIRFQGANLVLSGVAPQIDEDGATDPNGPYRPTVVGDEGVSAKLEIPLTYVRKLRDGNHVDLYDANANYWLARTADVKPSQRYLARLLTVEDGDGVRGLLRAFLSDRYRAIDNLDVLLATLTGVKRAGIGAEDLTIRCDLTDRRMHVRITSEAISANAEALVRSYRDPASGGTRTGRDYPLLFAGLHLSNSEVGQGGFSLTPRVVWQVCSNGQTMTQDAQRTVHLGGKLEEGSVNWSERTERLNLDLIASRTADAVAGFMTTEYLQAKVAEMAEAAGVKVEQPQQLITQVSRRMGFSKELEADILNAFIDGGQRDAGGVMQAVTFVAQQQADGDVAAELEAKAWDTLMAAAGAAR
jgi:hypothetical protein